jgi:hypothetical protein
VQWKTQLVRKHAYLAAMMGIMGDHVSKHRAASRPWACPAVAVKSIDAAV